MNGLNENYLITKLGLTALLCGFNLYYRDSITICFAAIVQQGSVFSQNTYKWVTNGGIQDIFQHPWVVKGLALVNEYLPFDKIEPQAIAEKIGQFATSFGSNLVAISAKILGDATNFLMDFS